MSERTTYSLHTFRNDAFGGLTAAVVLLPKALAFGVASGMGPLAGLYGAIAVCFFATMFGGTPAQISGPTGPMTVAMVVIVAGYADSLAEALTIVMLGGLLQIALGALRIGSYVEYTPYSVISGFRSGIGVIIILLQVLAIFGTKTPPGGLVEAILAWPAAMVNADAILCVLLTLIVAFCWPHRLRKLCPPPLAALAVGTLISLAWLDDVPVLGPMPAGLPSLNWPVLSPSFLLGVLEPAFIIALIGSIDSLLTSLVADSITRTSHKPNRELVGQGVGNVMAGLLGGLPGSGTTSCTVVNVRAGGRTRVSGTLCALLLLGLGLELSALTAQIPHAVLAGILMKVGWDIIDWRFLKRVRQIPRDHLVVMFLTLGLTVFADLVTAVAIGLIAAGMASSKRSKALELDSVVSVPFLDQTLTSSQVPDPYLARVGLVALRGRFSVASSTALVRVIGEDIREHEAVIFDFSATKHIDDSAAMVIERLLETAADENTECVIMGLSGSVAHTLRALGTLDDVSQDRFVESLDEAKRLALRLLDS